VARLVGHAGPHRLDDARAPVSDEVEIGPDEPLAPVVRLFPDGDELDDDRPLATTPRPKTYCSHWPAGNVELNPETRRCHCRKCGREVAAFDVLEDLAREWERYISGRKEAQRRWRAAETRLEDLLRQERNAKARARRRAS
jgi:hypothetical protein